MTEDDDGDIDGAKNGELICLFKETSFAFEECPKEWLALRFAVVVQVIHHTLSDCDHP